MSLRAQVTLYNTNTIVTKVYYPPFTIPTGSCRIQRSHGRNFSLSPFQYKGSEPSLSTTQNENTVLRLRSYSEPLLYRRRGPKQSFTKKVKLAGNKILYNSTQNLSHISMTLLSK